MWLSQHQGKESEVTSLLKKMDQYAKNGKQQDAEKVADEILKLMEIE